MRPRTFPPASMMCQRVAASADAALGMNVDDIFFLNSLSRTVPAMVGGIPPGQHSVGQVQATVNPNHTGLSGDCQAVRHQPTATPRFRRYTDRVERPHEICKSLTEL